MGIKPRAKPEDHTVQFARKLGADTGTFMRADEYYAGADLEEVIDDAWMMGATQDTLADAGISLATENRERIRRAFVEGFTAGFGAD